MIDDEFWNKVLQLSTIESFSKCALFVSGLLYAIGLLITNFNAQRYGRNYLTLAEAQYVLVGLLWLLLTLLTVALVRVLGRWKKAYGPWRGRPHKKQLANGLRLFLQCAVLWAVFSQVTTFAGAEGMYWSPVHWVILVVMLFTTFSLSTLFQETFREMNKGATPDETLSTKLQRIDSVDISKRILYFFVSLSFYSLFVYPSLSPAVGGGKLHQAEFIIRPDHRSTFDSVDGFKVDKFGRLGPVAVVTDTDESFLVLLPDRHWWNVLSTRPLLLKKDLVELVVYTK